MSASASSAGARIWKLKPTDVPQVYIAAGSNIEPALRLEQAARELKRGFPDVRFSACYRNAAYGFEGADFINAVGGFSTELSVEAVIRELHAVEALCGRGRDDAKWAPRVMDLDLLLYGPLIASTPQYRVPRPDLLKRAYMLGPMAELAPELIHPLAGQRISELWRSFPQPTHALERIALDLNAA
jgi:2-amino-4-hydroxy-6-hydroxymethyldihydropteridine diphosphokinase